MVEYVKEIWNIYLGKALFILDHPRGFVPWCLDLVTSPQISTKILNEGQTRFSKFNLRDEVAMRGAHIAYYTHDICVFHNGTC